MGQVEQVIVDALKSPPTNTAHWLRANMAEKFVLLKSTVFRIWEAFGLRLFTDPLFIEKVYDIVGLYLPPPELSVVLPVDEKSQGEALQRSQPVLSMLSGGPASPLP